MLTELTQEQREEFLKMAAEKRENDKEYARKHLRNDFADKGKWKQMASRYGVRLPSWYVRNTRTIRRAAKILGLDGTWVQESTGHYSLKELFEANPQWPSYAIIGLMLETAHEKAGNEELQEIHVDYEE